MEKNNTDFGIIASDLLLLPLKDSSEFSDIVKKDELSLGEAIVMAQIKRALDGDCKAFTAIKAMVAPDEKAAAKKAGGNGESGKGTYEQAVKALSGGD